MIAFRCRYRYAIEDGSARAHEDIAIILCGYISNLVLVLYCCFKWTWND